MKIARSRAHCQHSTKTLRFYENPPLPPPARTASGYRNYGPEIVIGCGLSYRGRRAGITGSTPNLANHAVRRRAHTSTPLSTCIDEFAQIAEPDCLSEAPP